MIELLFENKDIVVCIKPVGIVSQSDGKNDMVSILSEQLNCKIYSIHRLDTFTGGTMVFAKNSRAAGELSKQIQNSTFKKRYLAVLSGMPENKSGTLNDLLFKDSYKNKTYVVNRDRRGVKKASLDYSVISSADNNTLVSILLHTGRTHQIRVQFASRKLPLIGDGKYGCKDSNCDIALWSNSVEFFNEGKTMIFSSYPDKEKYPWNLFIQDLTK